MFTQLTTKLTDTLESLRGHGRLTDKQINATLREVRIALLEADVALSVVREFISDVSERALGQEVVTSLSPGQSVIKIVHSELVRLMGQKSVELDLQSAVPSIILLAGLQGAGKTTTAVKLAYWIRSHLKKSVLLTSCDVYRPAAKEQLKVLSSAEKLAIFEGETTMGAVGIAKASLAQAKARLFDVLIVDTAGRLQVDADMMEEMQALVQVLSPTELLFVADSMQGQDTVNVVHSFNEDLPLTGTILTKTDGDARGGATLTIRQITKKPIKFLGTSEQVSGLVAFHPERMASRILGMGDVLSLIEEVEQKTQKEQAAKLSKKIYQGKFTLYDFREQLIQMRNMGGISSMLDKLPLQGLLPGKQLPGEVDNSRLVQAEAIINSMTVGERFNPKILNGSRKRRIAKGAGVNIQAVNQLLKQFAQMQRMMKQMKKHKGFGNLLKGFGGPLKR